jgi:hypothetical protein
LSSEVAITVVFASQVVSSIVTFVVDCDSCGDRRLVDVDVIATGVVAVEIVVVVDGVDDGLDMDRLVRTRSAVSDPS